MDQTINIADLVRPKFEAGQAVFVIGRDYRGRIESVRPYRIQTIHFTVEIVHDAQRRGNPVSRSQSLRYYMVGAGYDVSESSIIASLDDLPAADRMPSP